jgi:hypothetical protein
VTGWLRVVMNNLKEVMLCVFEDHEDTFTFQDDFYKPDDVYMTQLRTKGHLSDSGLGYSRVLNLLAFLIFDSDQDYHL